MSAPAPSFVLDGLRPALWPGLLAVGWALLYGLGAVALAVALAGAWGGTPVDAGALVVRSWLVGQGSGLSSEGARISLFPWGGFLAALGVMTLAACQQLSHREDVDPLAFVGVVGVAYPVATSMLAVVADDAATSIPATRLAVVALLVGAGGALAGYASTRGFPEGWWREEWAEARAVIVGASTSVAWVLGAGLVIVLALVATNVRQAGRLWALLDPGVVGGIALAAVCVLCVPTLTLWAVSALLGPGFQVGSGATVDLTGSHLGQLPALPVLAALPAPGDFPGWMFLLGLIPALAAGVAGWRLVSGGRLDLGDDLWRGAAVAAGAGALGAVVLAGLTATSGGAVGPGRMADVGPESFWPLLGVTPFMAVAAAMGAVAAHYRESRGPADD
ncbi:MAG: DUF6350 family protein [Aeromicrobium sp.]|uniref:cell division protein PerM n=1 Tax=Aeromicrobium sp. TaxID=1871063 RepID=UPI0039E700E7